MKTDKGSKKKGKDKSGKKGKKSVDKKARAKEREEKRAARKGDGSFPDLIILTKEKDGDRKYFAAHDGESMDSLYKNDQTVAVYKLRRVSKMVINRKVAR